jgi:type VI protein secretion system component Hcp
LSTNETLNDVTIVFHSSGARAGKAAQTINLKNARIVADRKAGGSELITMEYDTIEVTWTDGGKTASDDWEAPN